MYHTFPRAKFKFNGAKNFKLKFLNYVGTAHAEAPTAK